MNDLSKNFSRSEFKCRCGCGLDTVDVELIKILEEVRVRFARPIAISSGHRCYVHNNQIGGSSKSQHLYGRAADFSIEGVKPVDIARFIDSKYGDKYGLGIYSSWVHLDTRSNGPARWG
jgi:uncharacterized protein YcbK (DUF882 family)